MSTVLEESFEIPNIELDKSMSPELLSADHLDPTAVHTQDLGAPKLEDATQIRHQPTQSLLAETAVTSVVTRPTPSTKPKSKAKILNRETTYDDSSDAYVNGVDPVKVYLNEIGKKPLLSKEDEVELSIAIKQGLKAKEQLVDPDNNITSLEKRQLNRQVRAGEEATNQFIESNLRLVVSIAKRYLGRGMELLDLIQEGNLGMMHAVEKFDHTKGFKFSTYATWWIRQAVGRSIADKSRNIRIPVHTSDLIERIKRIRFSYINEFGVEPSVDDIADATGLSREKTIECMNMGRDTLSLQEPIGEDHYIGDTLADKSAEEEFENALFKGAYTLEISRLFGPLNEKERQVISLRFGLEDGHVRTLEEVSKEFGVTRERIRQIQKIALHKMRHPELHADSSLLD